METIPINEPFDIDGSPTMYPPADVNSYDEETEIYTTNGWENVSELKEGSKCISLNPDNFDLEYVDVVKTYQHTPDKMVHFTTHNLDMMVTPDHNVFYQTDWKAKNNGNWQFVKAKDLIGKVSGRFYRSSKWVGTYPMGLKLGDFDVTPEQYAEFMALYLSDGNIVKERGRVDISKTREKYPEDWELLNDLLTEIGFTYNYNGEKFAIHHKALADQLEIFGKCNEKYIPDEIKNATPDVIRVFLNAYTRGDGYVTPPSTINGYMNESRNQYFTTSKRLADDIGELILKIGKRPSFHLRPDKGKVVKHHNGEYAGNFDLWIIYECSSQHAYIGRMEINEVPYNGTAYCVDLEKYHTLLTRRNGKVVWSGNCRCWLEYS